MKLLQSRLFRLIITLASLALVVNLSRSIYDLWRKQDILGQQEQVLAKLEAENRQLEQNLEEVQSPSYIERQAREKLGLVKEGETIVIMPNPATGPQMTDEENQRQEALPNWKKWWKLFFE